MRIYLSKTRLFILAEMLKGRKLRIVNSYDKFNHSCLIYYIGKTKVNSYAANSAIKNNLVKSIGNNRFEITFKGKEIYSKYKKGKYKK